MIDKLVNQIQMNCVKIKNHIILLDLSLCTNGFTIDSNGITKEHQALALGKYNNYQEYNGRQSFKHAVNNRYLYWATDGRWKVCSPKIERIFYSNQIFCIIAINCSIHFISYYRLVLLLVIQGQFYIILLARK